MGKTQVTQLYIILKNHINLRAKKKRPEQCQDELLVLTHELSIILGSNNIFICV